MGRNRGIGHGDLDTLNLSGRRPHSIPKDLICNAGKVMPSKLMSRRWGVASPKTARRESRHIPV